MRTLLTITFLFGLVCVPAVLAQHNGSHGDGPSLAGTWELSFNSPHGAIKGSLKLQQDHATITGTCELENMGSSPVNGKIDGQNVALKLELHGGEMKLTLNGKIDGNKLSGDTDPPGGNWTAARK
jgi:autotransporter translocation and assembly factor TamB